MANGQAAMTEDEIKQLLADRPQDIHDDLIPIDPANAEPDEEEIFDVLVDIDLIFSDLAGRALPKYLKNEIDRCQKHLNLLLNQHRVH